MSRASTSALLLALAALTSPAARAQDEAPPAPAEPVEERLQTLLERLDQLERAMVERQPRVTVSGFIDVGFFAVQGDGTGIVQDVGPASARYFPAYADRYAWVFLGDLLSPAINTRGEPASLGDPPGIARFDSIDSHGAPGFIANEMNVRLTAAVADNVLAVGSVSFAPRRGSDFRSGDAFEVELAQFEWMVGATRRTSIFAGKIDPVIGIEYRERKSDRRFGITPSLIARYTTGAPVGIKVRSKLAASERVVIAAAVTNGSSGIEGFHFHDDVDSNAGKTGSLRISVAPALPVELELGASGSYGSQDRALDSSDALWFVSGDLRVKHGSFELKAEWLHGHGKGERDHVHDDPQRPWGLRLNSGGYAELDWLASKGMGLLARIEHRHARVWLGSPDAPGGADRLYLTRSWRMTVGARWAITDHVVAKAEVLKNGEYGGGPDVRNDIFTSSVVLIY